MASTSLPACFNALSKLMPVVRAHTARRLIREGLHQDRVAEHLGVSQAMVSKYVRAPPTGDADPFAAPLVEASVRQALADEAQGRVPPWCPVCLVLCDKGLACASKPMGDADECLRHERTRATVASERVLAELRSAEERLRRIGFERLVPEVRSNLALALADAKSAREVAAFPGRLVEIKGEVRGAAPPEFGSSTHLASLLLKVRRRQPQIHAILNARYDDQVRRAARAAGLRLVTVKRSRGDLTVALPKAASIDAVVDEGAFGIEPALYIVGPDANDVVRKASAILQRIPRGT